METSETEAASVAELPVKGSFPQPLEGVDWLEVRRACEAGLTLADASRVFGIDREAVKQRAWREEWLHPAKIEALRAEKLKLLEQSRREELSPACNQMAKRAETAVGALTDTLEGHRSRTVIGLAKLAQKGVERAISADLPIENWQDAKIVADIAMKLHNVGQEGVNVNVLVGGDGGFDGPVISLSDDCDMDETGDDE